MAKSFLVSPGRAYLVIAGEGTKIVRSNGTLIDTVPEGANNVSITVDTHEIIVMDNAAKIQQLYNGNSGSSGIATAAEGEDAGSWKIEIVRTLPEVGSPGVIYMVRTTRTGTDRYDDYIWIPADNAYELLGRRPETASVDLSNVAKTNAANTFSQPQRVNNTLYATTMETNSIWCERMIESDNVSAMTVAATQVYAEAAYTSRMTILDVLRAAETATIYFPGMTWRSGEQYISVSRRLDMQSAIVNDNLRVSNMFTLGNGGGSNAVTIDGNAKKLSMQELSGEGSSVELTPQGLTARYGTSCVTLTGNSIAIAQSSNNNAPIFSVSLSGSSAGVTASTNGDLTMNGTISIPGMLNVHNLNITGTVTGTAIGGDTPGIDVSQGLTVMATLTADDIVAKTVKAKTVTATESMVVAGQTVMSHDGADVFLYGSEASIDKITTTTLLPTYIQGATLTGPLIMTKDNALEIRGDGMAATLKNGNVTGVYYAQVTHCTVADTLSADGAKVNRLSVADRLVVKDLVVTGSTEGIATGGSGGGGDTPPEYTTGDFVVDGTLSANAAVLQTLELKDTDTINAHSIFSLERTMTGTPIVKLRNTGEQEINTKWVVLDAPNMTTDKLSVQAVLSVKDIEGVSGELTARGLTVMGNLTVPAAQNSVYFQDNDTACVLRTHAMRNKYNGDATCVLALYPGVDDASRTQIVALETYSIHTSYINTLSTELLESLAHGGTGSTPTGHISKVWCLQLGSDHENPTNFISVVSPLRAEDISAADVVVQSLSIVGPLSVEGGVEIEDTTELVRTYGLSVVNALTVDGSIATKYAYVTQELVAPNIKTTRQIVHATPTGTADTLCRWAQIGKTHEMLAVGLLSEITLPGPSVQKLPTNANVTSFMLSLWYQADDAGSDIRLIGVSSNAVKPGAGTGVNNTWKFNNIEIKEEYIGRNLRLLMLPASSSAVGGWTTAASNSNSSTCYIQGRYISQSTDADCAVSASDSGNVIYKAILDARFTIAQNVPAGLTQEQESLLDWLAANKDALANLLASASSST